MQKVFDVGIIGGGLLGAGILRDCTLRGLKAFLVEMGDLGSQTTANLIPLISGGLEHLLSNRPAAHARAREAGHIVRIAGGLLKRQPMLWPVYRHHRMGLETVETLMEIYDDLQKFKGGKPHLRLNPQTLTNIIPGILQGGLLGGVSFDDWSLSPVEFTGKNVNSAVKKGASCLTRAKATELMLEGCTVTGVKTQRMKEGIVQKLRARIVINAAGPWSPKIAQMAGARIPPRLRKETSLVYPERLAPTGIVLKAPAPAGRPAGRRNVFLLPCGYETVLGPARARVRPEQTHIKPEPEEIRYLIESARRYFPAFPRSFARAVCVLKPEGCRIIDHETTDGINGLLTVAGGELGLYRKLAEEATDAACRKLHISAPCTTHMETLEGRPVEGDISGTSVLRHISGTSTLEDSCSARLFSPFLRVHALAWFAARLIRHHIRLIQKGSATPPSYWIYYSDAMPGVKDNFT